MSLAESAYPALALSLVVHNPGPDAVEASFMLALPFGGWTDCGRPGGKQIQGPTSYQACMHACTVAANCSSWEFDGTSGEGGACFLNQDVGYTEHKV